jgi:hypothetical protein
MAYPLLASVADSVRVWRYEAGDVLSPVSQPFFAHGVDELHAISWNHTNQVVATAGGNQINLIHAQHGQLLSSIPFTDTTDNTRIVFDGEIRSLAFSSNSRIIASSSGRSLHVWDLKRRVLKAYLTGHRNRINAVACLHEGEIISGDNGGVIRLWDASHSNSNFFEMVPGDDSPTNTSVTCVRPTILGSTKFAAGYSNGSVSMWDPKTGSMLRKLRVCPSGNAVSGLSFSPRNAKLMACCGVDGRLALVDISSHARSDTPSAFTDCGHHLTSISFHEDAIHSVVGTQSGQLLVYDWRSFKLPVSTVEAHGYPIKAAAFQNFASLSKDLTRSSSSVASAANSSVGSAAQPAKSAPQEPIQSATEDKGVAKSAGTPRASTTPANSTPAPNNHNIHPASALPVSHNKQQQLQARYGISSVNTSMSSITDFGDAETNGNFPVKTVTSPATTQGPANTGSPRTQPQQLPLDSASPHNRTRDERTNLSAHTPLNSQTSRSHIEAFANPQAHGADEFDELRRAVRPVTSRELNEALQMLKYDIHKEVQEIIKDQMRLFNDARASYFIFDV